MSREQWLVLLVSLVSVVFAITTMAISLSSEDRSSQLEEIASAQSAEIISATYCKRCEPNQMFAHAIDFLPEARCSSKESEGTSIKVCEGESKAVIVSNPTTKYSKKFIFTVACESADCNPYLWVYERAISKDEHEAVQRFYRFYEDYTSALATSIFTAGESGIVPGDWNELHGSEIYNGSCIMGEQNPVNYLTDAQIRKDFHHKIADIFARELVDQSWIKVTSHEDVTKSETPKFGFTNKDSTIGLAYEKSQHTFEDYLRYDFGFKNDTSINFRVFLGGLSPEPTLSEFNNVSIGVEFDWATSRLEGMDYVNLFQDVQPYRFGPDRVPPCLEELFDPTYDHYENLGPTGTEQTVTVDGVELQMCEISRAAKACAPNGVDSSCRRIKIKSYVPCDDIVE